jgi:cell wall-associated NlpC family hydrolase/uncharacterized protein (UPF0333 family)
MCFKIWFLIIVFFAGFNVFSQEKYIQHSVSKGETISKIAQQYNIKSNAIYEINPDAKKGIKFKSILLIPIITSNNKNTVPTSELINSKKTHSVLPKETLYGIARQYGVTVDDLYKINPSLRKSGLKKGEVINISIENSKILTAENTPIKENLKIADDKFSEKKDTTVELVAVTDNNTSIVKEVLPKETLYGIAKEYGVSVNDLEKANPILETKSLRIGQKLIIPTNEDVNTASNEVKENKLISDVNQDTLSQVATVLPQTIVESEVVEKTLTHEVLSKETKYGIAKEYGVSVKELERQNPKIVKKLLVGDKLTIRTSKNIDVETPKKEYSFNGEIENKKFNYDVKKSSFGDDFIDQLIATASENIGTRYRTGGTTKDGFDCSGLMFSTFGAFDIQLPRTSFEQSQYGIKINNEDAQKGDLIFFKTNGRRQINHVGMVVEVCDGDIKFIHASVGGGVIISSVREKYYSKRVTQINRVL